jgi:hypothetical protein
MPTRVSDWLFREHGPKHGPNEKVDINFMFCPMIMRVFFYHLASKFLRKGGSLIRSESLISQEGRQWLRTRFIFLGLHHFRNESIFGTDMRRPNIAQPMTRRAL